MMKATLNSSLIESCDSSTQDSTLVVFDKLLTKVKRVLPSSNHNAKQVDNITVGNCQPKEIKKNRIMKFLVKEYRKACFVDQSAKDDFFFRCDERRKNIPKRIWDRHSAFLLYSQQSKKQINSRVDVKKQPEKTTSRKVAKSEHRMSFKVCSVKPLPVWSTAMHELSCIECDISILRLLEIPELKLEAAEAA